jgi:ATP-dependent Lon protease
LAWTEVVGEILHIESSLSKGNGQLSMTGNLGKVMQESATLALQYLKAHATEWEIDPTVFDRWNIHVHIPEGAIPKDGPSAGITLLTALASLLTQRKIKRHLALTGELTLRGKVLPVGGIKEKILAAKRATLKEIVLSQANRNDIEQIPELYLRGLKFHYVDTIRQVLEIALLKQKVANPIDV